MNITEAYRLARWWAIFHGPRRDVTVQTANGLLTISSKQWLIGKYLYVRRSHEEDEIKKAVSLLRAEGLLADRRGTVINVGANIGMTAIALMKQGHFSKGIAFEPDPENFRLLTLNVNQNGLADLMDLYALALTEADGVKQLELSKDNSGDHRIREVTAPGFFGEENRRTIPVDGASLDSLVRRDPALQENVDLVWVDIQGHEGHFFQGARKLLKTGMPVISEFWPYGIERAGMSRKQFLETLGEIFTHFYDVGDEGRRRRPIDEVNSLFDCYPGPRNFGLLALV